MGKTKQMIEADYVEAIKTTRPKKGQDTLLKALNKFQKVMPILAENTKGYNYSYVDLAEIIKTITPLLAKYKLGVIQPLTGTGIKTIVYHTTTGDTLESYTEIPQGVQLKGMNAHQSYGSAITYFRRYSLCSMLGLVSDKDIDASGEQVVSNGNGETKKLLPTLTDAMFKRAMKKIALDEYQVSDLVRDFQLSKEQLVKLEEHLAQ